jgi:hypothetical protein
VIACRIALAASVVMITGAQPAAAQTPASPPANGSSPDAMQPRDGDQARQVAPGVLQPPPTIDPGMTKPAPDPKAFPTPVVPPPTTQNGKEEAR